MRMPATGTTATPLAGTTCSPTSRATTGSEEAATGSALHQPQRDRTSRRAAVPLATTVMKTTNSRLSHSDRIDRGEHERDGPQLQRRADGRDEHVAAAGPAGRSRPAPRPIATEQDQGDGERPADLHERGHAPSGPRRSRSTGDRRPGAATV